MAELLGNFTFTVPSCVSDPNQGNMNNDLCDEMSVDKAHLGQCSVSTCVCDSWQCGRGCLTTMHGMCKDHAPVPDVCASGEGSVVMSGMLLDACHVETYFAFSKGHIRLTQYQT